MPENEKDIRETKKAAVDRETKDREDQLSNQVGDLENQANDAALDEAEEIILFGADSLGLDGMIPQVAIETERAAVRALNIIAAIDKRITSIHKRADVEIERINHLRNRQADSLWRNRENFVKELQGFAHAALSETGWKKKSIKYHNGSVQFRSQQPLIEVAEGVKPEDVEAERPQYVKRRTVEYVDFDKDAIKADVKVMRESGEDPGFPEWIKITERPDSFTVKAERI